MRCVWCGSRKMRISRFQPSDILQLMKLQYPIRCHACLERGHVNFARALDLRTLSKWTSPAGDAQLGALHPAMFFPPGGSPSAPSEAHSAGFGPTASNP